MKNLLRFSVMVLLLGAPICVHSQQGAGLSSSEVAKLRDAQDPSERIKVYIFLEQTRLNRIDVLRQASPQAEENSGGRIDELLQQFISIDNELKDWIQYQYNHDGDMRRGLREILKDSPGQLQHLQQLQNSHGAATGDYAASLRDAIANLNDTIDGATQALAMQQKKFPAMKSEAKAQKRTLKKQRKEEAKRNKREMKLRRKEEKLNKKEEELRKQRQKKGDAGDSGGN